MVIFTSVSADFAPDCAGLPAEIVFRLAKEESWGRKRNQ